MRGPPGTRQQCGTLMIPSPGRQVLPCPSRPAIASLCLGATPGFHYSPRGLTGLPSDRRQPKARWAWTGRVGYGERTRESMAKRPGHVGCIRLMARREAPVPSGKCTARHTMKQGARRRGLWIVRSDVLEDVLKPALGLERPGYFCHERMRRPMSSFDIVRLASESARPRSTMT